MTIFYPTDEEDAREQKLPGWARNLVVSLRRHANVQAANVSRLRDQVDELETRLADRAASDTGPENSTAWLWRAMPSGEELPPFGLGEDVTVTFKPEGDTVGLTVSVRGNRLRIDTSASIAIEPTGRGQIEVWGA